MEHNISYLYIGLNAILVPKEIKISGYYGW